MPHPHDRLTLEVHDLDVEVLTGVYSEETHLPQPLRISVSDHATTEADVEVAAAEVRRAIAATA